MESVNTNGVGQGSLTIQLQRYGSQLIHYRQICLYSLTPSINNLSPTSILDCFIHLSNLQIGQIYETIYVVCVCVDVSYTYPISRLDRYMKQSKSSNVQRQVGDRLLILGVRGCPCVLDVCVSLHRSPIYQFSEPDNFNDRE